MSVSAACRINITGHGSAIFPARAHKRPPPGIGAGAAVFVALLFLTGSAVFPHVDIVVKRKSIFRISACLNADVFLFFFFTCFVEYFREKLIRKGIRRIPLGLVFFIVGRSLPETRYHRNRLNFIKPVISVCFESLPGINFYCSTIYIGINRQKIRGWTGEFSDDFVALICSNNCKYYDILPFSQNIAYTINGLLFLRAASQTDVPARISGDCRKAE